MHMARFLRMLLRLADEFGVAVVITNQVRELLSDKIFFLLAATGVADFSRRWCTRLSFSSRSLHPWRECVFPAKRSPLRLLPVARDFVLLSSPMA